MIDTQDRQDLQNLIKETPELQTNEAQKILKIVDNAILEKINKKSLQDNLLNTFNSINAKAQQIIYNKYEIYWNLENLKDMLRIIWDTAFKEYEQEQIQLKKEQEERQKQEKEMQENLKDSKEKQAQ